MNSCRFLTGRSLRTIRTSGISATRITGAKSLAGLYKGFFDNNGLSVNGNPVVIRDSQAAIAAGIGMVHQHFMLVPTLSVLENVMLGAEGGALLSEGAGAIRKRLSELGSEYGLVVLDEGGGDGTAKSARA